MMMLWERHPLTQSMQPLLMDIDHLTLVSIGICHVVFMPTIWANLILLIVLVERWHNKNSSFHL